MITRSSLTVAAMALAAVCLPSFGQYSVPPATYRPKVTAADAVKPALLLANAPARIIALPSPSAAERDQLSPKAVSANGKSRVMKNRRVQIGYAREVPAQSRSIRLSDLDWQAADSNLKAAQIRIDSASAAAMRIGVSLDNVPPELQMRFAGSEGAVFGPYSTKTLRERDIYWSPVLDGESAIIEIAVPRDAGIDAGAITIPMISHMEVAGSGLKQADPYNRIGRGAGSCEMDVACIGDTMQAQAESATNAVARMVFVDHGATYFCSGTLVNDSLSSMTPYFFTANHCIDNGDDDPAASRGSPAAAAATLNTYWFFQALQCAVDTAAGSNFVVVPGGATLVGRSNDFDWALLKLNNSPPAGATFAAWNAAAPIATNTVVAGIHHPGGDLKKWSNGTVRGYETEKDGSSYVQVQWSQGVTEPGSSGSGLFMLNPATNYYELRGGLWGGDSACTPASARSGLDVYSRLDVAYPYLAPSLAPGYSNPMDEALVVEYYNARLDDYFITIDPTEIADLDQGTHPGWVRTGLTFLAYANAATAPPDAKPVCRFYVLPDIGDSHFYSADADECAATAARFASAWAQESDAVFYIQVPDASGACPANTRPVFRFVNKFMQLHHRYTAEIDVRDSQIKDGGWIQEGLGNPPAQSVMCSPTV